MVIKVSDKQLPHLLIVIIKTNYEYKDYRSTLSFIMQLQTDYPLNLPLKVYSNLLTIKLLRASPFPYNKKVFATYLSKACKFQHSTGLTQCAGSKVGRAALSRRKTQIMTCPGFAHCVVLCKTNFWAV